MEVAFISMKNLYLALIRTYQYLSRLFPANCRYYPTCSEYAKWQFEFNRADKAFAKTLLRILRCNQLFSGGIDYPIVKYRRPHLLDICNLNGIKIKYWLVPDEKGHFFIIKDFDFNKN
jgi:putative membrane protein insertion efficiency factor